MHPLSFDVQMLPSPKSLVLSVQTLLRLALEMYQFLGLAAGKAREQVTTLNAEQTLFHEETALNEED